MQLGRGGGEKGRDAKERRGSGCVRDGCKEEEEKKGKRSRRKDRKCDKAKT